MRVGRDVSVGKFHSAVIFGEFGNRVLPPNCGNMSHSLQVYGGNFITPFVEEPAEDWTIL